MELGREAHESRLGCRGAGSLDLLEDAQRVEGGGGELEGLSTALGVGAADEITGGTPVSAVALAVSVAHVEVVSQILQIGVDEFVELFRLDAGTRAAEVRAEDGGDDRCGVRAEELQRDIVRDEALVRES